MEVKLGLKNVLMMFIAIAVFTTGESFIYFYKFAQLRKQKCFNSCRNYDNFFHYIINVNITLIFLC